MAFKIIWSEPALSDLASLTGFIAEDNPVAAEKTGSTILKNGGSLEQTSTIWPHGSGDRERRHPRVNPPALSNHLSY
jgi:plasmid stabilization system protein ParE